MTPFAQTLFRRASRIRGLEPLQVLLARAACFTFEGMNDLIRQTSTELADGIDASGQDLLQGDGAGLLVMPAGVAWFEHKVSGRRLGYLLQETEDEIGVMHMQEDQDDFLLSFIKLDGERFSIHADTRKGGQDDEVASGAALVAAAFLTILNAPRGVERVPVEAHRGFARDFRRSGFGELRDGHVVRIDLTPHDDAKHGPMQGKGKAFHFCRSHRRLLPSGAYTRVRAHWRGDPALGINRSTYRVAA